jgi:hypothetical protein
MLVMQMNQKGEGSMANQRGWPPENKTESPRIENGTRLKAAELG